MIDLITGHQGVAHISADQIASINNAMMDNYGANKVMRLVGGELTANGLTIEVGTGYWRANGFDMEVQEAETIYIDPTAAGLSRIDNIYVEILQDIPTGAQRSEIVTVNGEPSATPTAPEAPTAPELNTDILLQVVPLASVTVTEGAMVMTDLTIAYEMVTPSELEAVETIATDAQEAAGNAQTTANTASTNATNALNMIRSTSSDVYSSSKAYSVGDHVIYNNKVYKCITACSAGSWSTNQSCFSQTTLTSAVTDLNSAFNYYDTEIQCGTFLGVPLYKRTYTQSFDFSGTNKKQMLDTNFTGYLRFIEGMLLDQFSLRIALPYAEGSGTIKVEAGEGTLYIYGTNTTKKGTVIITVYYTKQS